MESFKRYFLNVLKHKYAMFEGRASRSEFWYYTLFYFIISFTAGMIDVFLINPMLGMPVSQAGTGGLLQFAVALALLVPTLAISVRRLHDIGKSGWWLLIVLIPIVGVLVLLYFYVLDSQIGPNRYGSSLKSL